MKRLPFLLAALLALAAPAAAQNVCSLVRQEGNWSSIGDPANRVISAQGPLLVTCSNGEELRADSAVIYQASNEVQLFRRVDYEDPTRSLTSDQATYNSQTGRLYATGNVVFVDKQKGSTLRGPELEYYRAMAGRPESQMTATQRPHVTVRPRNNNNASNPNRRREPMEIDGDRVTSVGDRLLTASGNVVINDNGTRSTAEEAFYDQAADHVELRRNAKVDNEKYHLQGELIVSDLKDGSVSKVVAQTNARLVSERLTVTGPQLQLFFERDLLQRMVSGQVPGAPPPRDSARAAATPDSATRAGAAGQPRPAPPALVRAPGDTSTARPAAPPAARDSAARAAAAGRQRPEPPVLPGRAPGDTSHARPARPAQAAGDSAASRPPLPPGFRSVAVAKGFRMEADSMEAILPDQRLRRVNAVGSAKGESWDTVAVHAVRVDSGGAAGVTPRPMTEPPAALHEKDMLTADTIIAFFRDSAAAADSARRAAPPRDSVRLAGRPATPPPAPGDTAKTELERLLAIGNAHSLYRMRNDSTRKDSTRSADKRPGLNYLIGDRIDLTFKDGEVDLAHVLGLKQGMYLDPDNPPADSTARDTTAAGRRAAAAGARGSARPAARAAAGRPAVAPPIMGPTTTPPATPPPSRPRPQTPPLPQAFAPGRAPAALAAPSPGRRT